MLRKTKLLTRATIGAAFLMANSSIGPGFLTQTSFFTQQLGTSFGFVILFSVVLDIGAQLNTWRVLTTTGLRAQDLSNQLLPGLGYVLAAMVIFGGFAFNIGNIAGCGLGLKVLTGLSFREGAVVSCAIVLLLFWIREIGGMLDQTTRILGLVKIGLTVVILVAAHPPVAQALRDTFWPQHISTNAIVTIVGGTVGGYITFSGAHRLIDAGLKGSESWPAVKRSAITGILISALMRSLLFLAVAGAVTHGAKLDKTNPAPSVFAWAGGVWGYRVFGVVLWSAAISSVLGAAYTSVSFFKTFHPVFERYERWCITVFIILSTAIFVIIGQPTTVLLFAGLANGLILPFALAILLVAATRKRLMGSYRHPFWMQIAGWVVVAIMGWMGVRTIIDMISR